MIITLGNILKECAENEVFVEHIGGDDFAIITNRHRSEAFYKPSLDLFSAQTKSLYTQENIEKGFIL